MKNSVKLLWIVAITVLIGISLAACDDGSNGSSGSVGYIGATLTLGGQVWMMNENYTLGQFNGNRTITSAGFFHEFYNDEWNKVWIAVGGESGSITNGQLSFTIDTPSNLMDVGEIFVDLNNFWNNFNISPSNAKATQILYLRAQGEERLARLSGIFERVFYVYVDRDITLTGAGKTTSFSGPESHITQNINLNLRTGWNAVHLKNVWSSNGLINNFTMSLGDPAYMRWILDEW